MYNNNVYNAAIYNADTYILSLSETVSSSDILSSKDLQRLSYESIPLVDNLLRLFNQVDEMGLDYLNTTDTAELEVVKSLLDSISTSDQITTVSFIKVLLENMSLVDTAAFITATSKVESIVLSDSLAKSVTDKGLTAQIRLQDWIGLRKTGDVWGD